MTAEVRIYRPSKTAMQSGRAGTKSWVLEFVPTEARRNDALTGWWGSGDTETQFRLRFSTREEAERYAASQGLTATVEEPHERIVRPKNYSDNFAFTRIT